MAQYIPKTVFELLEDIDNGKVILPSMQRNFVWEEQKICKLFDSLMHDYPIGTFMFWKIDKNLFSKYTFKTFVKDVDEQRTFQRGDNADKDHSEYEAVLDGQQRITSFYIGIRGSWRTHKKYTDWKKDSSFFMRHFCINILQDHVSEDEEYEFAFISDPDIGKPISDGSLTKFWVSVGDIIDQKQAKPDEYMDGVVASFESDFAGKKGNAARQMLRKLNNALCVVTNIHYYPATNKTLAEVGEIFVRVNNGGQKLSYSDLLLSIATGDLDGDDVHDKIEEKIKYINAKGSDEFGFKVDTELLLTAGLMFTNAKSLSLKNPDNYRSEQMKAIFEEHWDDISESLAAAVEYIEFLGFFGNKLTSKNLILPIAYYFYANNLTIEKEKGGNARACCDYIFIRQWLLRSMINSVFSDGIGSTLLRIRNHISSTCKYFPLDVFMTEEVKKGKTLVIEPEQIPDILDYKKGDARVIPLLMEIAHNSTSKKYDADHIWPQDSISTNKAIKDRYPSISDDDLKLFKQYCDTVGNLEILDPGVNKSKSDTPYAEWIKKNPQNKSYYEDNCIPEDMTYEYENFLEFNKKRRALLEAAIKTAFPRTFAELVNRYSLEEKLK